MRVLITGANGMLGSAIAKSLKKYEIYALGRDQLDITNRKETKKILDQINPHVIVHAAACTDVELSEIEPRNAYLANVIGTQNLVDYSACNDVLFIYISSTGIYGRKKEKECRYNEFDDVDPTTIHHKTKYEGEKIVINHLKKFLIIRTGWLFGGSINHKKNFVFKRFLEAKSKQLIYSDSTQVGNPTFVDDLAHQIEILLEGQYYGVFNCVNYAENTTRLDYVREIIRLFDLECCVEKAPKGMFKRNAPVSENESAENLKLEMLGINKMGAWEESLARYINEIRKNGF